MPVSFSVVSGPATLSENQLTLTGLGQVTVRAEQTGNEQFLPVSLERSFPVRLTPQIITWLSPTNEVLSLNASYPLLAKASSGLPVTFRVASGPAVITGTNVIVTNVGTVQLAAEQGGNAVYALAALSRTFNLVSLFNPVSLSPRGAWPGHSRGSARGIQVTGNYAYVADGDGGLQVIDVSNPANPVRVGGYDTSGSALGVHVVGNYAYVADYGAGLQVIDVSNPANPVPLHDNLGEDYRDNPGEAGRGYRDNRGAG